MREAFLAYVELMKDRAREAYQDELLIWAVLAPHSKKTEPPKLPDILKAK